MCSNDWAVFRQDFAGNEYLVEKHLSEERARKLAEEFEAKKHHQHYWVRSLPDQPIDFAQMLRESLAAGSTLDASLQVLRNQRATVIECINAIREVKGLELRESKLLVSRSQAFADQVE